MNITNIFRRKSSSNVEEKESLSNTNKVAVANTDLPKVIFEDMKLKVAIGQWLGILSSQKAYGILEGTIYTHLSAEELMEWTSISAEQLSLIEENFAQLLKLAGVPKEETCTLSKYDKDKFSFACHFSNSSDDAKIDLRYGDMMDSGPEFIIDYNNAKRTYDYWKDHKSGEVNMKVQHYTVVNPVNGNSCFRFYSPYSVTFNLRNGDYCFAISVDRPENVNVPSLRDYTFELKNEDKIQEYLLGLEFPFDINEVYKKICEMSAGFNDQYSDYSFKVEKQLDKRKSKITDLVSVSNGRLNKFVVTKGERTISVDGEGNWSYDTPKLAVSQSGEGKVSFAMNSIPSDELLTMASPYEQYSDVTKEIEEVRKLTKTIVNKSNN